MRVYISFYEASNYTSDNAENYLINDELGGIKCKSYNAIDNIGQELESIIADNYFNGAELACKYIGYSIDNEQFEFELMPC